MHANVNCAFCVCENAVMVVMVVVMIICVIAGDGDGAGDAGDGRRRSGYAEIKQEMRK